ESGVQWLLALLAAPEVGLTAVFLISLISATLLPLGSEPAVFAAVKANIAMFWPIICVATVGNTIGGLVNYWMGLGAKQCVADARQPRWVHWVDRFGANTLLLSWLPGIGAPLCLLAGGLKLPFWPCVRYMAVGKFVRHL